MSIYTTGESVNAKNFTTSANLSKKLNKTGDSMLGTLNMNENRIKKLPEPISDYEPTTKTYVSSHFIKSNDDIDMNMKQIKNLAQPSNENDAVNRGYLLTNCIQKGKDIDLENHSITNLAEPSNDKDAVNKQYCMTHYIEKDEDIDLKSHRIKNVSNPVEMTDAVNMQYIKQNYADKTILSLLECKGKLPSSKPGTYHVCTIMKGNKILIHEFLVHRKTNNRWYNISHSWTTNEWGAACFWTEEHGIVKLYFGADNISENWTLEYKFYYSLVSIQTSTEVTIAKPDERKNNFDELKAKRDVHLAVTQQKGLNSGPIPLVPGDELKSILNSYIK